MARIRGKHWSIETAGWSIDPSDDCVTLNPADVDAALQISSFAKRGGAVTEADLLNPWEESFASVSCDILPFDHPEFPGINASFDSDGTFWRVWSLRRDRVHLLITYNTSPESRDQHTEVVDWMVLSLAGGTPERSLSDSGSDVIVRAPGR